MDRHSFVFSFVAFLAVGCGQTPPDLVPPVFFVAHVDEAETSFDEAQFRSFRKDSSLSAPITLDGDTRQALERPA